MNEGEIRKGMSRLWTNLGINEEELTSWIQSVWRLLS